MWSCQEDHVRWMWYDHWEADHSDRSDNNEMTDDHYIQRLTLKMALIMIITIVVNWMMWHFELYGKMFSGLRRYQPRFSYSFLRAPFIYYRKSRGHNSMKISQIRFQQSKQRPMYFASGFCRRRRNIKWWLIFVSASADYRGRTSIITLSLEAD